MVLAGGFWISEMEYYEIRSRKSADQRSHFGGEILREYNAQLILFTVVYFDSEILKIHATVFVASLGCHCLGQTSLASRILLIYQEDTTICTDKGNSIETDRKTRLYFLMQFFSFFLIYVSCILICRTFTFCVWFSIFFPLVYESLFCMMERCISEVEQVEK